MNSYVIGYISFFDNELVLEYVNAYSWQDAVLKHTQCKAHFENANINSMSLEEAKQFMFDQDAAFSFLEIKHAQ